jgi:hypothetical protein
VADDIVNRLLALNHPDAAIAVDKIEQLQASGLAARHDLHAALIALNDLLADPRTQPDAQRTLRDITSRRKLNVNALRPLTRQAYGT